MWIPIDLYPPGYSINEKGDVRKDRTKRIIKPQMNQAGVVYVNISLSHLPNDKYRRTGAGLAKLVAHYFLEPPTFNEETNPTPIHLDGDHWNCAANNLMWRPRWFAYKYHQQFAEPYLNHIARPVRARGEREVCSSSLAAAMRYGLLEHDVVYAILQNNPVWPTYQYFELVE